MSDLRKRTDEQWKKLLTDEQYAMLRRGEMEPPFRTPPVLPKSGVFVCIGCGSPLFSPDDRADDDSGYVGFRRAFKAESVQEESHYRPDGTPIVLVRCATCGCAVGKVGDMEIRSDEDLESGTSEHMYHVSLRAIAHNGTHGSGVFGVRTVVSAMLGLVIIGGAAFFLMHTLDLSRGGGIAEEVPLWIRDRQVLARTYVAPSSREVPLNEALFGGAPALLVLLKDQSPRTLLCESLPRGSVLILLGNDLRVQRTVRYEYAHQRVEVAGGAKYILIQRALEGSPAIPEVGSEVVVTDKALLL